MKKHPFLTVEYHSSVKLSPSEKRTLDQSLEVAGDVLEFLLKKKVIPCKKLSHMSVSMLICGDAKIRELNREYRHKDKVTDVLSFPAHEDLRKKHFMGAELFLGDLAICHSQTKRQARKFSIRYFDEFIHLFFHGALHLMGYDHEVDLKEEKLMQKWETLALEKFSDLKKERKIKF